jgi:hypothetical protein
MQQHMRLTTYNERNTTISHKLEQLKHENALIRSCTLPLSDQDRELKVTYRCLSKAEHGWNYNQKQLDTTHVEVDELTHMIIHYEHTATGPRA